MELIKKYDRPGPRYTSYPAYPHWNNSRTSEEWIEELKNQRDLVVDLYLHIPYCQSLCTYCGCTRTISKNLDKGMDYTSSLLEEWNLYREALPHIQIQSVHLGGGTPTFLRPQYLEMLFESFEPYLKSNFSGAVEVDPRVTSERHLDTLLNFGIKRFSLGIQDFDPLVQKVVNRIQPPALVNGLVNYLRKNGAEGINFDLIYGLPHQTKDSILKTIEIVKEMAPETIALYGYAHVPWRSKAQKSLEKYPIPQGAEKRELYELSKDLLEKAGYREIGLDHFAKVESGLYQAFTKGEMKRNFMGYTKEVAPVTLGLGASAISNTLNSFVQNHKEVKDYTEALSREELPLSNGHSMSPRDIEANQVIQSLMCQGHANVESLFELLQEKDYLHHLSLLEEMEADGILTLQENELRVSEVGRPFLRNICMVFDEHLKNQQDNPKGPTFSRTI